MNKIKYVKKSNGEILVSEKECESNLNKKIRLSVCYCGVCGSDFQMYLNNEDIDIWGHEIVAVLNGKTKEYVIVRSSFPCNNCSKCKSGNYKHCLKWERQKFNGFSEEIFVDRNCIIPIKKNSSDIVNVLVEPMYVAINLVNKILDNKKDKVAIMGNGTIGLLCAFYLKSLGYSTVSIFANKTKGKRQEFAEKINVSTYEFSQLSQELSKYDKIINTAAYHTMSEVINSAKPHTCITFNGISRVKEVALSMDSWHFKNLRIEPSFPHPQTNFDLSQKIVYRNKEILRTLITHVISLEELSRVLFDMKNKNLDYIKVVVKI